MSEEVGISRYTNAKRKRTNRILLELSDAERETLDDLVRGSEHESMAAYLRGLLRHTARKMVVKQVLD